VEKVMQIRVVIADDEAAARLRLRRLLTTHPEIEIVAEASNGLEAIDCIDKHRPDLCFLDVEMPGLNGFEVLKGLSPETPRPLSIFITGFHEYALEAFRARAVAYLLKPIEAADLSEMIDRAGKLLRGSEPREREERNVGLLLKDQAAPIRQIVARKANRIFLIPPDDVHFFFMDGGIVRARCTEETYWVNYQLRELEEALEARGFFRARRSVLANLSSVKEIRSDTGGGYVLVMDDSKGTEIEVSERQTRALRTRMPGL
jgi:DNA-binding LytR/AlgR family response regulator